MAVCNWKLVVGFDLTLAAELTAKSKLPITILSVSRVGPVLRSHEPAGGEPAEPVEGVKEHFEHLVFEAGRSITVGNSPISPFRAIGYFPTCMHTTASS
jgi:hypothetical protein